MAGAENLTVERVGATMVVPMNRPEAKNALSTAMLVGMADAWVESDADDDVRCLVLTGAGGDFCTGMDLKAFSGGGGEPNPYAERMQAHPDLHRQTPLPHYPPHKPLPAP